MTDHWIEPEDLAAIPVAHRRTIARWLVQQGSVAPGGLLGALTNAHNDALRGAAVTLADPLAEDSTIDHARAVLDDLANTDEPVDPGARPASPGPPEPLRRLLCRLVALDKTCEMPRCPHSLLEHVLNGDPELVALVRSANSDPGTT